MGLEADSDKLLPDFANKLSTVGLEVEDLDKLLPDFAGKPSTVGLEVPFPLGFLVSVGQNA